MANGTRKALSLRRAIKRNDSQKALMSLTQLSRNGSPHFGRKIPLHNELANYDLQVTWPVWLATSSTTTKTKTRTRTTFLIPS